MAHRWHYSDWEERRKRQDPIVILKGIGLGEGESFIDIGSGNGFFSIHAARIVGEEGKVYAVDANPDAIEFLEKRATEERMDNVIAKVGRAEDSVLCEGCGDIVFFAEVLHDFQDQEKVLGNAFKMLKPGGRVVNLDWKKEHAELGPPYHIRFSEETAQDLLKTAGFEIDSVEELDAHHYIIMGRKQ
jgi:ubiquinone/menaquinone biosynthesis C-methylase UbiE